jgi:hypothetical protein
MQKPTKQIWIKHFKEIADNVRDAMTSLESAEIIDELCKKFKLQEDQAQEFASLVGLVMLGLLHPRDFIPTISEDVGVSMMVARDMAREVNERIFRSVRSELKMLYGIGDSSESVHVATKSAVENKPRFILGGMVKNDTKEQGVEKDNSPMAKMLSYAKNMVKTPIQDRGALQDTDVEQLEAEREKRIIMERSRQNASSAHNVLEKRTTAQLQIQAEDIPKESADIAPVEPKDQVLNVEDAKNFVQADKLHTTVSGPPEHINIGHESANNLGQKPERKHFLYNARPSVTVTEHKDNSEELKKDDKEKKSVPQPKVYKGEDPYRTPIEDNDLGR